ncbi:unnamed protein product, partial [Toxocara canis]|uniref:Ig-like domain-containing protein n=1 Tax=Toxocara canis TaxID=6265 RepID=A0A183UTR0_TOXCA
FFIYSVLCYDDAFARGNLEVIFSAKSAKSGEDHPQKANIPDLWCQARSQAPKGLLLIKEAHFIRHTDKEILPGVLNNNRAILSFGSTTLDSVGKYRCEIATEDGRHVWGWLFVNMRPVFHTNFSRSYELDEQDHFRVKGQTIRVTEGETVTLSCPVVGYPRPTVEWLKDDIPVASTEQITFLEKDLEIAKLEFDDEGTYSCIARNSFPEVVDGPNRQWESRLDIKLRVKGSYRWIYPLILIVIMLLLLFIIIYSCAAFNRYKSYNVEKRERW